MRAAFLIILSLLLVRLLGAIIVARPAEILATRREAQQRLFAQENASKNLARSLSEQAELVGLHSEQVDNWPDLVQRSVLLAVEGNSRLDILETSQSLRKALDRLPRSAKLLTTTLRPDTDDVIFDPSGSYLAVVEAEAIRLWRVQDGREYAVPCDGCTFFGFAADGRHFVIIKGNDIKVATIENNAIALRVVPVTTKGWMPEDLDPLRVKIDPQGRYLAIVGNNIVHLVDLTGKRNIKEIRPKGGVTVVALSGDGDVLATGVDLRDAQQLQSAARSICFWTRQGAPLRCVPESHEVTALAFGSNASGRFLAAAGESKASAWELTRWHKILEIDGIHADPMWVVFGPSGTLGLIGMNTDSSQSTRW